MRIKFFTCIVVAVFIISTAPEARTGSPTQWTKPMEPVVIAPYNPAWRNSFENEATRIEKVFKPSRLKKIEHFGSTSVKGMLAKPVIDILVGLDEFNLTDTEIDGLKLLGYKLIEKSSDCQRFYFQKRGVEKFNLSVTVHGSNTWQYCVNIRDYLRTHPSDIKEYSNVKLAAIEKGYTMIDTYSSYKQEYVTKLLKKANRMKATRSDHSK